MRIMRTNWDDMQHWEIWGKLRRPPDRRDAGRIDGDGMGIDWDGRMYSQRIST